MSASAAAYTAALKAKNRLLEKCAAVTGIGCNSLVSELRAGIASCKSVDLDSTLALGVIGTKSGEAIWATAMGVNKAAVKTAPKRS